MKIPSRGISPPDSLGRACVQRLSVAAAVCCGRSSVSRAGGDPTHGTVRGSGLGSRHPDPCACRCGQGVEDHLRIGAAGGVCCARCCAAFPSSERVARSLRRLFDFPTGIGCGSPGGCILKRATNGSPLLLIAPRDEVVRGLGSVAPHGVRFPERVISERFGEQTRNQTKRRPTGITDRAPV